MRGKWGRRTGGEDKGDRRAKECAGMGSGCDRGDTRLERRGGEGKSLIAQGKIEAGRGCAGTGSIKSGPPGYG
jgi:hypothetical protein